MPGTRGSRLLRYGFAFVAVALATALRLLLDPLVREQAPYTAYFLAIALTAWYGGLGPSLVALVASAGVSTYLFTPPRGSFLVHGIENQSALALFLFTGAVVALLSNLQGAGRRRAEGSVVSLKDSESQLLGLVEEIEKVMEVAPAAILIALDPACQRITGNRAANELYGVSGKINFSLTPPLGEEPAPHRYFSGGKELRGGELPMQCAAAQNKEIRDLEMQVFRQDGAQLTFFGGAIPLHDEHGRVRGCIAAFVDITARKKAEESLRKLSQAVEQSPVNVIITDLDGNIEYVNRRFSQLTGYTAAEVLGKNPRILKSGHTSDEEYRSLWQTIKAGGEWSGEFLNKAKDGSLFWERALITSIKDEAGRITHFLAVKEDITKSKEVEEKLQQMRLQLTHVARLSTLGEMAAELAHELNHPLYAILNYAKACRNVLAEEGPPNLDSLREWNEEIAEIALSAGEAVKRLRSFARRAESPRTRLPYRGDRRGSFATCRRRNAESPSDRGDFVLRCFASDSSGPGPDSADPRQSSEQRGRSHADFARGHAADYDSDVGVRRSGRGCRFRSRRRPAARQRDEDLRALCNHQAGRHGHGAEHRSYDCRGPRGTAVGQIQSRGRRHFLLHSSP